MGCAIASGGDPKGTGGERKAPSAPAGANPCRGAHTFLSVAKEKCAKESQRHGDSRGGPPRCASRASSCGSPSGCPRPRFASLTRRIVRARSSPFSAVKMGGPFSLRCLSPLCSPAVGGRQTYLLQVKMVPTAWRSCSAKYEGFCFRRSRRGAGLPHARPASREARCRAAVASRPCRMSPERPARLRRAVRGAGVLPLLLVGGFPVFALGDFGNEGNAEGDDVFHDFL